MWAQGNGSYKLSTTFVNSNGRVFRVRGRGPGAATGPVRRIPTPLLKQMVAGGASYQVDSSTTVFVDAARSQLARNRFSPPSATTGGPCAWATWCTTGRLPAPPWPALGALRNYRLRSTLDYEYTAPRFAPIDRYRDIEFDRNWSTTSTVQGNAGTRRSPRRQHLQLRPRLGLHERPQQQFQLPPQPPLPAGRGKRHPTLARRGPASSGNVEMRGSLFLLNSQAGRYTSTWARGEATARFVGGKVVPGYAYRFDKNRVALPTGDSIRSANYFDEHNVFVQSRDTARTQYRLDYSYRQRPNPHPRAQRPAPAQHRPNLAGHPRRPPHPQFQDLRLLATYRDLAARDSARQRTVLAQVIYNVGLLQNQVRSELTYSIATGRELKRDYSFLAVPAGQGTHYYAGDLNGNNRQDKEEFLEAQTADAQYRTFIKVYLPTSPITSPPSPTASATASPRPPRAAGAKPGAGGPPPPASPPSAASPLDRRTTDPALLSRLSPLSFDKEDVQLLAFNQLFRNTLYYNRSNPIFGAEATIQQTQQKTLLAQGFDLRNLTTQSLLVRRTLAQSFTGRLTATRDIREAQSTYLATRNFRLLLYTVQPEISYQPTPALRLTATYLRTTKQNTNPTDLLNTRGTFDDLGLELRISQVSKRTVTSAIHSTSVTFTGDQASVVGLEVLNALRPGANYTWNLNIEQRLSNGLNITLAYDGRKASGLNVVNTGRMQVAVLF